MGQTLAIEGRGRVSRKEVIKIQEGASRKVMTIRRVRTGALIATNMLVSLFILLLLLYAVNVAFTPPGELFTTEMNLIPRQPALDSFRQALMKIPPVRFTCSSFIIAGLVTVGQIIPCSLAAFSFSFLEFKDENVFLILVMVTMMTPEEATIMSDYLTVSQWNWLDSCQALIVSHLVSAVGIFLFRQFYKSFPISLCKLAKINGCGNLRFVFCILLPLTKSVVGTIAVYTFINAWNVYMWPLLVTGSNEMRTVQIGISMLDSMDAQSITSMIAGVVMTILPSISIFILGQKQLIQDMFSGAVKG